MNDLLTRLREQFKAQYEVADNGCWLWAGKRNNAGYGTLNVFGGFALAHRLSYELHIGPVPEGLVLDHFICDTRICVNYEHLKPATYQENILRGNGRAAENARKTHCPQGHPYTGDNLYTDPTGRRHCRACSATKGMQTRRAKGIPARQFGSRSSERQRRYHARQLATAEIGA